MTHLRHRVSPFLSFIIKRNHITVVSFIVLQVPKTATLTLCISVTVQRINTKLKPSKSRPKYLQKMRKSLLCHVRPS